MPHFPVGYVSDVKVLQTEFLQRAGPTLRLSDAGEGEGAGGHGVHLQPSEGRGREECVHIFKV